MSGVTGGAVGLRGKILFGLENLGPILDNFLPPTPLHHCTASSNTRLRARSFLQVWMLRNSGEIIVICLERIIRNFK